MKSLSSFFHLFAFISFFIIAGCGSDSSMNSGKSGSNTINSSQCGCTTSYMPVCGVNNITYDNSCIANCFGVTQTVQGSCICSERPVCADNNQTYSECEAQAAILRKEIKKIVKFVDCNSASF